MFGGVITRVFAPFLTFPIGEGTLGMGNVSVGVFTAFVKVSALVGRWRRLGFGGGAGRVAYKTADFGE